MSRRPFLVGLLCGTLLTAVVVFTGRLLQIASPATAGGPSAATPAGTASAAVRVPPGAKIEILPRSCAPSGEPPRTLPPGSHKFYFNGQPVYEVPLAGLASR